MIIDFAKVYPSIVCQIEMFYSVCIKQLKHNLEGENSLANRWILLLIVSLILTRRGIRIYDRTSLQMIRCYASRVVQVRVFQHYSSHSSSIKTISIGLHKSLLRLFYYSHNPQLALPRFEKWIERSFSGIEGGGGMGVSMNGWEWLLCVCMGTLTDIWAGGAVV